MSWRSGALSTGEALVVPTSVAPCESVPEPRAPAILEDFGEGWCLPSPPAVLLNSAAGSPLPHSLSAITAVSLVRASAVQAVPGKSQARGSFPAWELHHAPSQATPVRLPVPGEERRWGKGSLGSPLNPSASGRLFPAPLPNPSLCALGKQCIGRRFVRAVGTLISLLCSSGNAINCLWQEAPAPWSCEFVLGAWEETRTVLGMSTHYPCSGSCPQGM